jgi:hypothetical protein
VDWETRRILPDVIPTDHLEIDEDDNDRDDEDDEEKSK